MADQQTDAVIDTVEQIKLVVQEAVQTHGFQIAVVSLSNVVAQTLHHAEHLGYERNAVLGCWITSLHEQLEHIHKLCEKQQKQAPRGDQLSH